MAIRKAEQTFLNALLEKSIYFKADVGRLLNQEFPSKAPRILSLCLLKASDRLIDRISNLISESKEDNANSEEILGKASNIFDFVDFSTTHLCPILRSSLSNNVPSELVHPLERIAWSLFPECQIIIGVVPEQNYYFTNISKKISELFDNLEIEDILTEEGHPEELFHLQLCLSPPGGVLMHCILGHEIGHAIYEKSGSANILRQLIELDDATISRLVDIGFGHYLQEISLNPEQRPPQLDLERTRQYIEYTTRLNLPKVISSWVQEIYCDIIGAGIFGPSFACALSVFLLPFSDIDEPQDTHPCHRLRMQVCLHALDRSDPGFGYRKLQGHESRTEFEAMTLLWKDMVGTRAHPPENLIAKAVFKAVVKMRNNIILEAKTALNGKYFPPIKFKKSISLLRKRIYDWLPPNEYQNNIGDEFTVASLEEIFNAGWLTYLHDMEHVKEILKDFSEEKILGKYQALLLKGIESSDIQIRWLEQKNIREVH